jgi:hypothetical protein
MNPHWGQLLDSSDSWEPVYRYLTGAGFSDGVRTCAAGRLLVAGSKQVSPWALERHAIGAIPYTAGGV